MFTDETLCKYAIKTCVICDIRSADRTLLGHTETEQRVRLEGSQQRWHDILNPKKSMLFRLPYASGETEYPTA